MLPVMVQIDWIIDDQFVETDPYPCVRLTAIHRHSTLPPIHPVFFPDTVIGDLSARGVHCRDFELLVAYYAEPLESISHKYADPGEGDLGLPMISRIS